MTAFILLHGFAQTPASWDGVASALQAAGHRTFVPDLFAWLGEEGCEAFMNWWETMPLFASQRALPAPVRAAVRAQRTAHNAEVLAQGFEAWGAQHQALEGETLAALRALQERGVPVRYLAGSLDAKYTAVAERVRAAGLAAQVVPEAGHNIHLERPQEFLAALSRS